ncbi:hypothetical protein J6590_066565 [Homalodisca vitripennis]|nr:hypothetical protein J6590_066565 [Homalodisca vitripennis]
MKNSTNQKNNAIPSARGPRMIIIHNKNRPYQVTLCIPYQRRGVVVITTDKSVYPAPAAHTCSGVERPGMEGSSEAMGSSIHGVDEIFLPSLQ